MFTTKNCDNVPKRDQPVKAARAVGPLLRQNKVVPVKLRVLQNAPPKTVYTVMIKAGASVLGRKLCVCVCVCVSGGGGGVYGGDVSRGREGVAPAMFGQLPEFPVQCRDEEGEVMVPCF